MPAFPTARRVLLSLALAALVPASASAQVVYAWGSNSYGQLGNGTTMVSAFPVPVFDLGPLGGQSVTLIAAGGNSSSAIVNAQVVDWGNNANGQLGNGTTVNSSVPGYISTAGVLNGLTVTAVAGGLSHSLAIANGQVYAWGYNGYGQLGNNSTTNSGVPVAVSAAGVLNGLTVTAVAGGSYHSLALASNGRVYAWGYNNFGQLGNNSTTTSNTPVAVSATGALNGLTVTAVAAGDSHNLAIANGQVYAWGNNTNGQLGNGSTTQSSVPVAVSTAGVLNGLTVTSVAGGGDHSLAVAGGRVFAWGYGNFGQLGNNGTTTQTLPVAVASPLLNGLTVTKVAAGAYNSYALTNTGRLFAWGANGDGELGLGSTITQVATPQEVFSPNGMPWTNIDADANGVHVVATAAAAVQRAYAWGLNNLGQLGNGTTTNSTMPVAISTAGVLNGLSITATAGGGYHNLALANGQVYAWGRSDLGQLGNGSTTNSSVPVAVSTAGVLNGLSITAVAGGGNHSLALARGKVYTWGWNGYGQLGNGSTANSSVPVAVSTAGVLNGLTVTAIASGTNFGLALANGQIFAWGFNGEGELGSGTTTNSSVPVAVSTAGVLNGLSVTAIAGGLVHSLALANGKVYAWGYNGNGELGNGSTANSSVPVAVSTAGVLNGLTVTAIAGGGNHSLALANGKVYAWGYNASGQLGTGSTTGSTVPVAVSSATLSALTVAKVAAAISSSYALTDGGRLFAWGDNSSGQLGLGTTTSFATPQEVVPPVGTYWSGIDADALGSHAVATTARLANVSFSFGNNANGQLGNGTTTQSNSGVAVTSASAISGKNVAAVAGGVSHGLALAHGKVYAWGNNGNGQLGNGTTTQSTVPVAVSTSGVLNGLTVTAIAGGDSHSLALANGQVFAWGYNGFGSLGNGSTTDSAVPVAVSTAGAMNGLTATAVAGGYAYSLAVANGRAYAWGYNGNGQLGNGTTANSNVPVAVSTSGTLNGLTVTAVAAGIFHGLALANGRAYAWGYNGDGELGNGSTTQSTVPLAVSTAGVLAGKTVTALAAGGYHNVVVANGQVFTWGLNGSGQLGNGTTVGSAVPVAVSSATLNALTVTKAAASRNSSYALTDAGRLFAWGENGFGQLGLGNTTQFTTPQEVFAPTGFVWTGIEGDSSGYHAVLTASPVSEPGMILGAGALVVGVWRKRRRVETAQG